MTLPIGVFDSGIGGLSILRDLRAALPQESFVYYADSAHNPYGEKGDAFVIERSRAITRELVEQHQIKALVVACNTATAAAIHVLRAEFAQLPIVGVEPALKPAAASSRTKRIAVFATRGTLGSSKFRTLHDSLKAQAEFVCTPCDGLAELIERHLEYDKTPELIALCADYMRASGRFSSKNGDIDSLVLGCTHYPLVRGVFEQLAGSEVQIIDNGPAVARRLQQLLQPTSAHDGIGTLTLLSSDSPIKLQGVHDGVMKL
jgi:glutamate racemase